MQLTRRGILAGAAAGGGLLVAWWLMPRRYPVPLEAGSGEHLFGAWLRIGEDGVVTVAVPQLEMGQGITTLLPQIIAQELGADWRQMAVEPAPASGAYGNVPLARKWIALWDPAGIGLSDRSDAMLAARFAGTARFMTTADGTALDAYEQPCREAAACARAMLAQEAADRWDVAWEECEVSGGFVRHGDKQVSFGTLVVAAAAREVPDPPPLRPEAPREEPLPTGSEAAITFPRLDLPSKVDGSWRFAGDVRLPGMVFASIRHGPLLESELKSFDREAAGSVRGLAGIVASKRWLAAAGTTWWAAEQALKAMRPRFSVTAPVSTDEITAQLAEMVRSGPGFQLADTGLGGDAMARVDMARIYEIDPAYAAPLETATATARLTDGKLELWIASQAPEQARIAAARAIGLVPENVALYPMAAGGSFDARLEHDHAIEIAQIAQALAKQGISAVQLTWPRRSEMIRARPRPPAHIMIGAQLTQDGFGGIEAMRLRIACPPGALEFGHRLFGNLTPAAAIRESTGRRDVLACEGAVPPYAIPAVTAEHIPVEIGLPVGRVRGNAHGYTAFAIESFIDEVAAKFGREPLSFRMAMLGTDVRLAICLQRAARLAGWDGGADQSGEGLACTRIGDAVSGARIALIASVRPGEGGGLRVTRLSAAVDIGRIVNLDIARQQIEGGLLFGMGIALGNTIRLRGGIPERLDYGAFGVPALPECPEIAVEFIESEAPPADPGELGAIVAPPAIANALFSARPLRLRRLPLLSEGI